MILLDFFEILLKFRWNFWKFHGNPLNLQISMNFRGCRDKTRTQMREETQRRPVCPAPTWRRGFGGRKRTLPRRGGEGKKLTGPTSDLPLRYLSQRHNWLPQPVLMTVQVAMEPAVQNTKKIKRDISSSFFRSSASCRIPE